MLGKGKRRKGKMRKAYLSLARYAMDSRTFFSSLATLRACSALLPAAQAGRYIRTSRRVLCRALKSTRHKST